MNKDFWISVGVIIGIVLVMLVSNFFPFVAEAFFVSACFLMGWGCLYLGIKFIRDQ